MSDTPAQRGPTYSPKSSSFLDEVRKVMHLKHMSRRTEASYLHYIIAFILWGKKRFFHQNLSVPQTTLYGTRFSCERAPTHCLIYAVFAD
jgi:hypothetical protein